MTQSLETRGQTREGRFYYKRERNNITNVIILDVYVNMFVYGCVCVCGWVSVCFVCLVCVCGGVSRVSAAVIPFLGRLPLSDS